MYIPTPPKNREGEISCTMHWRKQDDFMVSQRYNFRTVKRGDWHMEEKMKHGMCMDALDFGVSRKSVYSRVKKFGEHEFSGDDRVA